LPRFLSSLGEGLDIQNNHTFALEKWFPLLSEKPISYDGVAGLIAFEMLQTEVVRDFHF